MTGRLSRSLTTRQDWIDAAYTALGESGPDGVNIEALASRLGVSKAGFYHRFKDRQELLDEAIQCWIDESTALIERGSRIAEPREQLSQVGFEAITSSRLRRADTWLLLRLPDDPRYAELSRGVREQTLDWVQRLVQQLGFSEREARIRARLIWVGYLGLTADVETTEPTPSHDTIRTYMDELITITTQR